MKLKKPWWVCAKCEKHLARVGTKRVKEMMLDHREECEGKLGVGFYIKQIKQ